MKGRSQYTDKEKQQAEAKQTWLCQQMYVWTLLFSLDYFLEKKKKEKDAIWAFVDGK